MKNWIKNSLLIGSKAFAELFFQTHHSPSLPLLPGANSIISLTMSYSYEHPLSFSFMSLLLFLPPSLSPCPPITPSSLFSFPYCGSHLFLVRVYFPPVFFSHCLHSPLSFCLCVSFTMKYFQLQICFTGFIRKNLLPKLHSLWWISWLTEDKRAIRSRQIINLNRLCTLSLISQIRIKLG